MILNNLKGSILIMGDTGSGKSYFARFLCESIKSVIVVIDIKNSKSWNNFGIKIEEINQIMQCLKNKQYKILMRPNIGSKTNIYSFASNYINNILEYLWNLNTDIYVVLDEASLAYSKGWQSMPQGLGLWSVMGREKNHNLITCTQRPTLVARTHISQALHLFLFRLNSSDCKSYLNHLDFYQKISKLTNYNYIYFDVENQKVHYCHAINANNLNLKENKKV